MFASIALVLALAGPQPAAAQAQEPATAPAAAHAVQDPHAAGTGPVLDPHSANPTEAAHGQAAQAMDPAHGAEAGGHDSDKIDYLHHILDAREIELPGKTIHLPAKGTFMVGALDMTPTKHMVFLVLAGLLTLLVLLYGGAAAHGGEPGRAEGKRYNAIEAMVLYMRDQVVMPNIGHGGEKYVPFVVTLFFFILFNNMLGLLPYGSTATANISVTAGLAILAFLLIEVSGMVALGPAGYLHTIFFVPKGMHPVAGWMMAVALAPVELMGKITKPISLAIRLMANMTAGHIVLLALISLIFVFGLGLAIAPVLMATAIFFLEIFVSFLQAFIFAMLTSVFIGLIRHAH